MAPEPGNAFQFQLAHDASAALPVPSLALPPPPLLLPSPHDDTFFVGEGLPAAAAGWFGGAMGGVSESEQELKWDALFPCTGTFPSVGRYTLLPPSYVIVDACRHPSMWLCEWRRPAVWTCAGGDTWNAAAASPTTMLCRQASDGIDDLAAFFFSEDNRIVFWILLITEQSTAQHILGTIATEGDGVFFITVFSVALGRCAVYGRVTF
jgi:hypothetical protein